MRCIMNFIDKEHEKFYNQKIGQTRLNDRYEQSLLYLLASTNETRQNFEEIYTIEKNEINLESLKSPWQTGTSIAICRLAFNVFGDIVADTPEERTSYAYTISEILKHIDLNCAIEAFKIRFL